MSDPARFGTDSIASPPGVGLDVYYITDAKRPVGLKPGIIAKTHSELCASLIVAALNFYDSTGGIDGNDYEKETR